MHSQHLALILPLNPAFPASELMTLWRVFSLFMSTPLPLARHEHVFGYAVLITSLGTNQAAMGLYIDSLVMSQLMYP
jgi:hypothetical protein